jgi:cytochrome P450
MTFLSMGSENVSTGLAWLAVLLSEHYDVQHRALGSKDDLVTSFHEAMRLYPSVAALTRANIKDTEICGYHIPAFTEVNINMYSLHRKQETWGEGAFYSILSFKLEAVLFFRVGVLFIAFITSRYEGYDLKL